ncbi:MAG TPA: amidohydrolase family protein [Bryobacteraceae bacterium]|jgi:predicted TIM-barrel fold metal-dependent hydrolase
MNRRQLIMLSSGALALRRGHSQSPQAPPAANEDSPEKFILKDYRPVSIYRTPRTEIAKAKYPVVDVHCHGARPIQQLDEMVKTMDAVGIEKTVIFTGANSAERFAEVRQTYSKHAGRFELWCSFDLTGADQPGFGPNAVKALEDCHRAGAMGVGEISDKGFGFRSGGFGRGGAGRAGGGGAGRGAAAPPATPGPHADDARMDGLWDKCAQLGMPANLHISDPIWSYQPMDLHNDGLMNGYTWRIDEKQPGLLGHNGLIESLERAVRKHPKTVFIACHLANLDYDLTRLGQMFDRNPNLYADISARFAETAPIPRFVNQFLQKYPDRVLYGTDMAYNQRMFSATFRILESNDEHFYERDINFNFDYHWPLYGLGLPDPVLKKVYRDNALRAFQQARKI